MVRKEKGFTLIELVLVIVVLGILAAVAIPRYIALASDARIATVNGMAASVRSAVTLARARYMVVGNTAAVTVTMDGTAVACAAGSGIPTGAAAGIGAALQDYSGFTPAWGSPTTFQPVNGGSATCQVSYDPTTGNVTPTTTGC